MKFLYEHIKSIIIILLAIIIFALGCKNHHVPEPPGFVMQPPPGKMQAPASTKKITGTVLQYGSNPQADIDKILIEANGAKTWLHFPPHTAKLVLRTATLYTNVTVMCNEKPGRREDITNELQTIWNDKNEIVDVRKIIPPAPAQGPTVTVTGSKIEVKQDDNGNATAFVLANKLIMLPPHAAKNLLPLITAAKTITVIGNERDNADGFVNVYGLNLVRPDKIILDGTHYLLR